ncbi:MAG: gamma-glutamylcyclotransferase family protein [Halarcobacter sp.]
MYNLVVYGSLMNKKELQKEGISLDDVVLVKVFGYKRVFNQEPSYRMVNSVNRAVLTIGEDNESWFNAIVIKNISAEYLSILDKREIGYDQYSFREGEVISYDNEPLTNCIVYKGKIEKMSFNIQPNMEYLDICKETAKSFGDEFYEDFINTTFKNSDGGLSLI